MRNFRPVQPDIDSGYPSFDSGFAHRYPLENALREGLQDNSRVITEFITPQISERFATGIKFEESAYKDVVFPIQFGKSFIYHIIPDDSRDLRSYIRLLNDDKNAEYLGKLLGKKLTEVRLIFGGVPSDTILNRFAVFTPEDSDCSTDTPKGFDMRLLPPFNDLDAPGTIDGISERIREDISELSNPKYHKFLDIILESVAEGLEN